MCRFFLFFGTFDAVVLIASIYTFFPKGHLDKFAQAMQHFQWSIERFETMSCRNALAKAAADTLRTFSSRLKQAVDWDECYSSADALAVSQDAQSSHMQAQAFSAKLDGLESYSGTISSCKSTGSLPSVLRTPSELQVGEPSVAPFDWSLIEPIYATGDIAYNDLIGNIDLQEPLCLDPDSTLPQFSGNFGNNSVWSILNQDFCHDMA